MSRSMPRSLSAALVSGVLLVAAAACSSDSTTGSGGGATSTGATTVGTTGGTTDGTADGTTGGTTDPAAPVSSGDPFCDANAQGQAVGDLASFATASKTEIRTQIDAMVEAAKAMQAAAPDEIQADVDTVMGAQQTLVQLLAEHDDDFQALAQDPKVQAILSDQDYIDAGRRLQTFVEARCGTGDSSPGTAPDGSDANAGAGSNGDPATAAFCQAQADGKALGQLTAVVGSPKEDIQAYFDAVIEATQTMRDVADEEIQADLETVIDGQQRLAQAAADHDYDFTAMAADPEVATMLQDPAYATATQRLQRYVDDHCA